MVSPTQATSVGLKTGQPAVRPMALHEIIKEAERQIDDAPLSLPLAFRINWQGLSLSVSLITREKHRAGMTIETCLGRLPYSAESHQGRLQAVDRIIAFRRAGRDHVELDTASRVSFTSVTDLPRPQSLLALVQAITLVMLALDGDISTLREHLLPPK